MLYIATLLQGLSNCKYFGMNIGESSANKIVNNLIARFVLTTRGAKSRPNFKMNLCSFCFVLGINFINGFEKGV